MNQRAALIVLPLPYPVVAAAEGAGRHLTGEPTHMTDERHRPDDHHDDSAPWWWGLGPMGAIGLVVLGIAAALWSFFRLPGTADDRTVDYHGAARVIAIGLVVGGTLLLSRTRARASHEETPDEGDRD